MPSLMKKEEPIQFSKNSDFESGFDDLLSFITELCDVPYAFISHIDNGTPTIKAQIRLERKSIPEEIILNIISVIEQNTIITVSKNKVSSKNPFESAS